MTLKRTIASAIAIIAALALAACSKTVDSEELEGQLAEQFASQSDDADISADCPDDEEAEEGNEFTCTITDAERGDSIDVLVTMTDDDGSYEAQVEPDSGGGNGGNGGG